MELTKEIMDALGKPFDESLIKTRDGNFGKTIRYVSPNEIIRRLNEVLQGRWSFEILSETITENSEVIVKGRLSVGSIIKCSFGTVEIKHKKGTGEIVSLGDDYKAAATDAFKKAATQLGVPLELYEDQPDYATSAQVDSIKGLAEKKGLSIDEIDKLCKDKFGHGKEDLTAKEAVALIADLSKGAKADKPAEPKTDAPKPDAKKPAGIDANPKLSDDQKKQAKKYAALLLEKNGGDKAKVTEIIDALLLKKKIKRETMTSVQFVDFINTLDADYLNP